MSSTSRISLHECTVELSLPLTSSFSDSSPTQPQPSTPEEITLLAAELRPKERSEIYVGDTIFLLVSISGPSGINTSAEVLHQALDAIGDIQVFMGRDRTSARSCSLPILSESSWIGSTKDTGPGSDSLPSVRSAALCKGVWALVRTPPEHSELADVMFVTGKQEIFVIMRERSVSHGRKVPVWATIDKASRLFGKSFALTASKPLLVVLPVEISCSQLRVGDCSDKAMVCITATNVTDDAHLTIVPPYVNVNSSRIVDDPDINLRASRSSLDVTTTPNKMRERTSEQLQMALDDYYEFVPLFMHSETSVDEDDASFDVVSLPQLDRSQSLGGTSCDDYGLFIPSFNHWQRHAVSLGPRQVYNFVYKVRQRGTSQYNPTSAESSSPSVEQGGLHRRTSSIIMNTARKLKPGTCLETSVAIAWNCVADHATLTPTSSNSEKLSREMSSGGVLATGKRSDVAVRLTAVHWRPPALVDEVVVAFSGPAVAGVGDKILVAVSVLNQTGQDLIEAAVLVQQDEKETPRLLALRTVVVVGRIPAGTETTLQLPCVALASGTLSLRPVQVVDRGVRVEDRVVWTSQASYRVFVVDREARVPGDPEPPGRVTEGEGQAR